MPKLLDSQTFDAAVNTNETVLVDFYADWCGPCKILAPTIDQIEKESAGDGVLVAKVDVDQSPELAQKYGVMGVPTVLVFRGGQLTKRWVGVQPKDVLVSGMKE